MSEFLLKGGKIVDTKKKQLVSNDILVKKTKISRIGKNIQWDGLVINCENKIVAPGLFDLHVHFRNPGQEYKEKLGSGSMAALVGGFTTVVAMANTDPVIDNPHTLEKVLAQQRNLNLIDYFQATALTKGLKGRKIIDLAEMKKAGCIAASEDGKALKRADLLVQAMVDCRNLNLPFLIHCEDTRWSPYDAQSEYQYVELVLYLAEKNNCPVHLQHISSARSVQLIREAKVRGVKVTAETAPHYISLTEADFLRIGANAKMNPPLRSEADRLAVIAGLKDGTIDVIATDHAPHSPEEKAQAIEKAPNGVIGLETALAVALTYLKQELSIPEIIAKMTINPARIMGMNYKGVICQDAIADLTIIDPDLVQVVDVKEFYSLSRNCPWEGQKLKGWPVMTIRAGAIVMENGRIKV